ncbi:hypothetical protein LTR99_001252 [Exophiala xenobiotica]|uniref:EF-hand domain-containing protein n=1 Tax=Vermiconidia calcicola TaxID=1690605 RepID=A0AAV9QME9_9PEZI|nr:hypothetical protein H2202_002470 [Exophiala xenobiotica]KAK5545813.1 hypothetical protein LTR25_000823 [Vermiconidia calcicola]KAK5549926.1 hypothetical protein LTR23_000217 [Chaetothyriales sp. CCFEE 6169]KAK5199211.1 hypothetical protein LTR92_001685 [Exophiala xenobiotica]KAK5208734.1 hypothetical protein LTR41_005963 [Exophiala xenobiotica]
MAYNRAFNPDALPAHAEPEQAAQALSQLQGNRNPSPNTRYTNQAQLNPNAPRPPPSGDRRTSPASQYRPPPAQNHPQQRPSNNQSYVDNQYNRLQSPPPQSYGYGRGHRPQPEPRRSSSETNHYSGRTTAPPDPDSADLFPLFRAANQSGTGLMTTTELGSALVNADFTPFDGSTISSLMRMFTTSPPNQPQGPTITFTEFESLWRFLAAWRTLFERFDEDGSGRISLGEFSKAMTAFGYRLSQPFVTVLYHTFNDRSPVLNQGMSFDLFVQACISLKRMTDVFKKYDDDRDGYVTMSFEEFLTEILRLRD